MAAFWLDLGAQDYVDPDWRALARAGLHRFANFGGLLRGAAVERAFRRRLGGITIGQTKVPLYAVMWNVDENRVEYFGSKCTPKLPLATVVRTAISIPIFVEPVRIGRHLYGDGGVVNIFPVRPLVDFEEPLDFVVGVNCYYPENFAGEAIPGWRNRTWAVLRAAGQLRSCVHLELAREQMKLLGDRLTTAASGSLHRGTRRQILRELSRSFALAALHAPGISKRTDHARPLAAQAVGADGKAQAVGARFSQASACGGGGEDSSAG